MLFWPSYVYIGMKYDISSTISSACENTLRLGVAEMSCQPENGNGHSKTVPQVIGKIV
jgi:hypothetical protein